jgi:hypothetical protein
MTQDEVIEMPPYLNASYEGDDLFSGQQLIAAVLAEREACAKVCENRPLGTAYDNGTACAAAIRARGEQA